MNGRVFDPFTGRFLSADSHIQDPTELQSYNRYSYCFNSPMLCTDPSGYINLGRIVSTVVGAVVGVATLVVTGNPVLAGAAFGFVSGMANGGNFWESMAGGVVSGTAAGAAYGIGTTYQNIATGNANSLTAQIAAGSNGFGPGVSTVGTTGLTVSQLTAKVLFQGVSGAYFSVAGGGGVRGGFIGGAVGELAASYSAGFINGEDIAAHAQRMAITVVAGGTASTLTGDKFANGAMTAAFVYMFNHCSHVEGGCWKALKDAGSMTMDWLYSSGDAHRYFGPGSIQVIDMADAPGVNAARDYFYKKNSEALKRGDYDSLVAVTSYPGKFGAINYLTTSSPTQQFVGSYGVDIYPNGQNLNFVVTNNSSFRSFSAGLLPDWERGAIRIPFTNYGLKYPMGNLRQTYYWTESIR